MNAVTSASLKHNPTARVVVGAATTKAVKLATDLVVFLPVVQKLVLKEQLPLDHPESIRVYSELIPKNSICWILC
jgi:hypothetical protein